MDREQQYGGYDRYDRGGRNDGFVPQGNRNDGFPQGSYDNRRRGASSPTGGGFSSSGGYADYYEQRQQQNIQPQQQQQPQPQAQQLAQQYSQQDGYAAYRGRDFAIQQQPRSFVPSTELPLAPSPAGVDPSQDQAEQRKLAELFRIQQQLGSAAPNERFHALRNAAKDLGIRTTQPLPRNAPVDHGRDFSAADLTYDRDGYGRAPPQYREYRDPRADMPPQRDPRADMPPQREPRGENYSRNTQQPQQAPSDVGPRSGGNFSNADTTARAWA